MSCRVFSSVRDSCISSGCRKEPEGKRRLTIYWRWCSRFLSLDAKCEISIKANKGRVTIWAYCLLSSTYTLQLPMAGCCSLPFCLLLSSFSVSPFLVLFTLLPLSLFSSSSLLPSASARRHGWMVSKWLLARWLNGRVDIFPSLLCRGRKEACWPSPPALCAVVSGCSGLLPSYDTLLPLKEMVVVKDTLQPLLYVLCVCVFAGQSFCTTL